MKLPEYTGMYKIGDIKDRWFVHRHWTNGEYTMTIIWMAYKVTGVGVSGEGTDDKPYKNYELTKPVYKIQKFELNPKDLEELETKEYF